MAQARLPEADYELAVQLEWEDMSPAQLDKAKEVWSRGDVVQQESNSRVWRIRSYSGAKKKDPRARKYVHVTLMSDRGYPAFTCTCLHGQCHQYASCWHAKIVARIYRIIIEQRKAAEKRERLNEYRSRGA